MNMVGKRRAGLYDRVSKKATGKEARSLASQKERNEDACGQHGWIIAARYTDPGISASRYARRGRDDWPRLLADIAAGVLDVVVLWESSRGDRQLETWAAFLRACRENNVLIYVTSHGRLYNMRNRRDWRTLAEEGVDAEDESNKIADRVQRGLDASLGQGRPHGRCPFGMIREYDQFRNLVAQRPDPETAWAPQEVLHRLAAMEPESAIARDMAARNAPTPRGGKWTASLVRRIGSCHAYAGHRYYDPDRTGDGVLYDGMENWEPLVDLEIWRAANTRVVSGRRGSLRPGQKHKHLLSYLAECGKCEGQLSVRQNRGGVPLYFCKDNGCSAMRMDWLDDYVTGHACARLNTPDFWDELLNPDDPAGRAARAEEADLRQQLAAYEQQAIDSGVAADSFGRVVTGLMAKIADAGRRGSAASVSPYLQAIYREKDVLAVHDLFDARPVQVRKAILRDLYSKIALLPAGHRGRVAEFDRNRVLMVASGGRP